MIQIEIHLHQDDVFEYQMNLCQFRQVSIDFVFIEVRVTEFFYVQFSDVQRPVFVQHRFAISFDSMVQRFAIVDWHFFGIFSETKRKKFVQSLAKIRNMILARTL